MELNMKTSQSLVDKLGEQSTLVGYDAGNMVQHEASTTWGEI
jgi:hypothetical protein